MLTNWSQILMLTLCTFNTCIIIIIIKTILRPQKFTQLHWIRSRNDESAFPGMFSFSVTLTSLYIARENFLYIFLKCL